MNQFYLEKLSYELSVASVGMQFLKVEFDFQTTNSTEQFSLALWRPGRYEAQNYAKNIVNFSSEGYSKINFHTWEVLASNGSVKGEYLCVCNRLDAGSSWIDPDILYLNLINCIMVPPDYTGSIELKIAKQDNWEMASTNPSCWDNKSNRFVFSDIHQMFDTAFFYANQLKKESIHFSDKQFDLVFFDAYDSIELKEKHIKDFDSFIRKTCHWMVDVPFERYSFLYFVLPNRFYHGVEHQNGTVITIGAAAEVLEGSMYPDFLGISSHELFHAWNVCRMRPKSLTPYQYFQPVYLEEGVFLEGFTTYMGDWLLFDSGVYSLGEYINELNSILKKHLENQGNLTQSLIQSSFDLWVDGYQPTHQARRVSIYEKGCIVSLILDDWIREATNNKEQLIHFIRKMWEDYGRNQNGYTLNNIIEDLESSYGIGRKWREECLESKSNLLPLLLEIRNMPFKLVNQQNLNFPENQFGFRAQILNGHLFIEKVDMNAEASQLLRVNDQIMEVNKKAIDETVWKEAMSENTVSLKIKRMGRILEVKVNRSNSVSFDSWLFEPK